MILAADVGGTKTNLALFREAGGPGGLERVCGARLPSAGHDGMASLVRAFFDQEGIAAAEVTAVCFGIAGPVIGNRADPPNLPWDVDGDRVADELGLPRVLLINDLVATGHGIETLVPEQLSVLQAGEVEPAEAGRRVLAAAGTGFGATVIPRVDGRWRPLEGEAGHADFAPRNDAETDLLRFLQERHGRVSVERAVSGPGIAAIYDWLTERGFEGDPAVAEQVGTAEDPARVITETALAGGCPRTVRTLDVFTAAYGAALGNLALVALATGGAYVGGGIAPKILPKLQDGTFLDAFRDKGRFARLMEKMPVCVVLEPETALRGAAWRALQG